MTDANNTTVTVPLSEYQSLTEEAAHLRQSVSSLKSQNRRSRQRIISLRARAKAAEAGLDQAASFFTELTRVGKAKRSDQQPETD